MDKQTDGAHPMTPAAQVEAWNKAHKVGKMVSYRGILAMTKDEAFVDKNDEAKILIITATDIKIVRLEDVK